MKSKQSVLWLYLALGMLLSCGGPTFAAIDLSAANVSFVSGGDVNGDGVANTNDTLIFQCLATETAATPTFSPQYPWVDLSLVGGSAMQPLDTQAGILYSYKWVVPAGTINYANYTFTILAKDTSGNPAVPQSTQGIYIDNARPLASGTVQFLVNGVATIGPALAGDNFAFQIEDSRYQSIPGIGNTTCSVDLSAIGMSAAFPMTYVGGNTFRTVNLTAPAASNDVSVPSFKVRLSDPFGQYSDYYSNPVLIDQNPPAFKTATVQILSGNPIARPGDILRISAELNNPDGDTLTASQTSMTACSPLLPSIMSLSGTVWTIDVTLTKELVKSNALPIDIIATDNAGNTRTRRVQVPVDLDPPGFTLPKVEILSPDTKTVYAGTIASATDWLHFTATITVNLPDTLQVTANLSPIGGAASHALTLIPPSSGTDKSYEGAWQIPVGALEDVPPAFSAEITAKDAAGNVVVQLWSPPIYIDNHPPTVTNANLARVGGGAGVKLGDQITISCQVTNVDGGGPPWVDLRSIGGIASATLTEVVPGSYSSTFIVGAPIAGFNPIDTNQSFLITTYDNAMNSSTQYTNQLKLDNEPPVQQAAIWTVDPPLDTGNHQWVHIGDNLTLQLRLAPPYGKLRDNENVTVDLTSVGGNAAQVMTWNNVSTFTYSWKVATGTLNNGATFPVSVTDDDGNNLQTQITVIPFDNKPPVPGIMTMTGKETVESAGAVNIGDVLTFKIPMTSLESPDDHANAILDLSTVGGDPLAIMNYSAGQYSITWQATPTATNLEANNFNFTANVYDKAGNFVTVHNGPYTNDCWPPRILDLRADLSGYGSGTIGIIGTTISFHMQTAEEDGGTPYINLSSFGRPAKDYMIASSASHWWDISFQIATGTLNDVTMTWAGGIQDNAGNIATATTPALEIDNMPPQVGSILVDPASHIKLGQTVTFSLNTLDPVTQWGAATLDLTPIGGINSTAMTSPGGAGPGGTYTLTTTTLPATVSYTNQVFHGLVTDMNGNKRYVTSSAIDRIDCQPPVLNVSGIYISQTNGDNPSSAVANINDQITVFTGMTNSSDASAAATIVIGGIDTTTASCAFIPARNRYEAVFTVPPRGGAWGDLHMQSISYRLTASDDVGNSVASGPGISTFTVDNTIPIVTAINWRLSPDNPDFDPVLNVGSGSPVDLLWVEATIDKPLSSAFLNLSSIPGAPASVPLSLSDATARSNAGVAISSYSSTDATDATFSITLRDLAGNAVTTTKTYRVDTKRPQITHATYDGAKLSVVFQEPIRDLDISQWDICGSDSKGLATFVTPLSTETQVWFDSFDVILSPDRARVLAGWASQPLTLRVKAITAAPVRDLSFNWGTGYGAFPITITDSTWRQIPRITNFIVTSIWPASPSIVLDLAFNKPMDPASLIASNAVLLYKNLTYDFSTVDYQTGYVFQPEDTLSWTDSTHLRITLCEDGAAWVARKLGNGITPLSFATRTAATVFVRDSFGKAMQAVSTAAPVAAIVARPYSGNSQPPYDFAILGGISRPILDLTNRTLTLTTSDRTLLYQNDFQTLSLITPHMGMPVPSFNQRATGFHNHIQAWDQDLGTSRTLVFDPLDINANPVLSSTTITLKLTDADVNSIFALFASNPNISPIWGLKIDGNALNNWWGQPNQPFMPSGNPGDLTVIAPTVAAASLVACSISDASPIKAWPVGALAFECEIKPVLLQGVPVPISLATPTGRILRQDTTTTIVNGLFTGWSTRTVDGAKRYVARFINAETFPADIALVASVAARIEIAGARDIFGNVVNDTASFVYDLATKKDTAPGGFTTSSAPLVVDTALPVIVSINPPGNIGVLPSGAGIFEFTFSELMYAGTTPAMNIATTGRTIACSFLGWAADGLTARFTNTTAIELTTPNGSWNYEVSAGSDLASNVMALARLPVEIRTQAPAVIAVSVSTVQSFVSPATVLDQPFSPGRAPGYATIHLTYALRPTRDLPHVLRFYDTSGSLVAAVPVTMGLGVDAIATLTAGDFSVIPGPAFGEVSLQVRDAAGNETGQVKRMLIDQIAPNLTSFTFSGIGTFTNGILFYSPVVMGNDANVSLHVSNATDALRLTAAGLPTALSTTTWNLASATPGDYSGIFGSNLADGMYGLSIVDAAGNPATGDASRTIIVDRISPTVVGVTPAIAIGGTPMRNTTFSVAFSERMDPNVIPTLELATTTPDVPAISMAFTGWDNPANAMNALFVNAVDINSTYPAGTYTYNVSGGTDLARNLAAPSSTVCVNVQSQGPVADFSVLTTQPGIFAGVVLNQPFSPLVSAGASASISLTYQGGPFNAPHRLIVFDDTDRFVATLSVPTANPTQVVFPNAGSFWAAGTYPGNNVGPRAYHFKLLDRFGNFSADYVGTLTYDTRIPTVTTFAFDDGGRGLTVGGVKRYSPAFGPASITVTSDATDTLRLIVVTGAPAPANTVMTMQGNTQTASFGDVLADCIATFTVADLAGNFAVGNQAGIRVKVDGTAPRVSTVLPLSPLGGFAAGGGTFDITFNEPMNPASAPAASISSGSISIQLIPISNFPNGWVSSFTCRMTNAVAIQDLPISSYTWSISGGVDEAGNVGIPANFDIWINSQGPAYSAVLRTRQRPISSDTWLLNQPLSPNVSPGFGFLSVTYQKGPFGIPHRVLVNDPTGAQVATIPLNPVGTSGTATVNLGFFGQSLPVPVIGPISYGIQIQDDQGNISPSPLKIVYDTQPPTLSAFTLTGGSRAVTSPVYLNPLRHGTLNVALTSNGTDTLRLIIASDTATTTFSLIQYGSSYSRGLTPTDLSASMYPDGAYRLTAADAAGNLAIGASATRYLVIDRVGPTQIDLQILPAAPLYSMPAGGATFTVVFSEMMDQLASATPGCTLSNGKSVIACRFVSWSAPNQAVFTNTTPITPDLPSGNWQIRVTGYDLADNPMDAIWPTPVIISPRGPIVSTWRALTYQRTTASLPYPSGQVENQPFGPSISPYGATLSVTLNAAPDASLLPIRLHFTQNGTSVASFPITFAGTVATFTWNVGHGPIPAAFTTYKMRLYDAFGNPSLETYDWSCDPSAPTVARQTVSGGIVIPGDDTVYYNPALHGSLSIPFLVGGEDLAPIMRVRGSTSTDTFAMTSAAAGTWNGSFNGTSALGKTLSDGVYIADVVDHAGNAGVSLTGQPNSALIVLDTTAPQVTTYTIQVAGVPVNRFAPAGGPLDIGIVTPETLSPTGLQYLEVRTDTNILVRSLPLTDTGTGILTASWDGMNSGGKIVSEGVYRLCAVDVAGNHATNFVSLFVSTSTFRLAGMAQVSPTELDMNFTSNVDESSLSGATITPTPADISVSALTLTSPTRLRVAFDRAFTHGVAYTITIAPNGLRSVDGVGISAGNNTAAFTADTRPPAMTAATTVGTNGPREFIVTFDERLSSVSAQNPSLYQLTGTTVAKPPVSASIRSDGVSVLLVAYEDLVDGRDYRITAIGIEDLVGNKTTAQSAAMTFRGRDTTPPDLKLAIFSNPAIETDIIAAVKSTNDDLPQPPTLDVTQGTVAIPTISMTKGVSARQYMAGVHFDQAMSGFGTARVTGLDAAGNQGTAQVSFSVATVNASKLSSLKSADGRLMADFPVGAVRGNTLVKILPQPMTTDILANGRAAVRPLFSVIRDESKKLSVKKTVTPITTSELVPVGDGFEIAFTASKLVGKYSVSVQMPANSGNAKGVGLYQMDDAGNWSWMAASNVSGKFESLAVRPGVFALLRDLTAPRIKMETANDPDKPITTARPKFSGRIEEYGAGLNAESLMAVIDGTEQTLTGISSDGAFVFIPTAPLTSGRHELIIHAKDRAGNIGESLRAQFAVKVPLAIGEIMSFPNPARGRSTLRIGTNSGDVLYDLIEVRIYDVAGHLVRWLDGVAAVRETGGTRYLYDVPWDLRNQDGRMVANGVYLAKVEVHDPYDASHSIKKTHKIVVMK
ncbi:MAG: hypothetical protein HQM09_13410 [Candidatus Riflebacteria bacterium]|nr:hypothetical protein [Candidatus Riflebacteria bacterium]